MPNPPDYKRVQLESGAKITVLHVGEGMTPVDEPAVDRNGRPLDATYPEQAGAPAEKPYSQWLVADLEDEIDRRNDARGDEDGEIVPEPPANKPQLVAALEADDAARA